MTARLIDNTQHTLRATIAAAPATDAVSIATGFVTPLALAAVLDQPPPEVPLRLLLGAEAEPEPARTSRRPGDLPPSPFERARIAAALAQLETAIRKARDREPFTLDARAARARAAARLRGARAETRQMHLAWLPAKLLLRNGAGVIAASSNISPAGLETAALNIAALGTGIEAEAKAWFDRHWQAATPFDLASLLAEPDQAFAPWLIFLRMLLAVFGAELAEEQAEEGDIPLTAFQRHGVWRAQRIMREHGGVLIADEVGLGKTFIGAALLEVFDRNRQRALLVCPAAVRDNWIKALTHVTRRVRIITFDELARDRRFQDARRPLATRDFLLGDDPDDYALVVVDEAHAYRNPDAPYRAAVLRALLSGENRKQVALLTATPVNNSLYDLRNLMQFFLAQDAALARHGVVSLRETFRRAARKDPANLSPDELFPVIDAVTVKRTRAFVKRNYPGETIRGPDGVLRPIVFPKPVASSIRYALDDAHEELFEALADALDPERGSNLLRFARYSADAYRRDRDADVAEASENAAGLLRSALLKRFESSKAAFCLSLARMITEHDRFLQALERGRVISTAFLRELAGGDDDAFDALLDDAEHSLPADAFDVAALKARIQHKLAQAGRSIGVAAPLDGTDARERVFAETRAEIEKLANGDASLFEQGGTQAATQSGEEYRQILRAALARDRLAIERVPGGAGSGMVKGAQSGVLFCAEVTTRDTVRAFLRFVPATADWQPAAPVLRQLATCLRLAECVESTPRVMPDALHDGIFAFWPVARADILDEWEALTDPATLQPRVALVNRQVASFLRRHPPPGMAADRLARALDIVEAPWPAREEAKLRTLFRDGAGTPAARSAALVALIFGTGLPPFQAPAPMPPVGKGDVQLVCWLALSAASAASAA